MKKLSDEELVYLCTGDLEMLKTLMNMFPTVKQDKRIGKVFEQNCTAIPVAAAIAQSFNRKAAEE